jgi:hypothetical protein
LVFNGDFLIIKLALRKEEIGNKIEIRAESVCSSQWEPKI